jgi:hypothetical protein
MSHSGAAKVPYVHGGQKQRAREPIPESEAKEVYAMDQTGRHRLARSGWRAALVASWLACSGAGCAGESGGAILTDSGCAVGQEVCGGLCVSLQSDASNCGACSVVCPEGTVCSSGQCVSQCAVGETQCGSNCVDTATDPSHCGMCDVACGAGQTCSGGVCVGGTVGTGGGVGTGGAEPTGGQGGDVGVGGSSVGTGGSLPAGGSGGSPPAGGSGGSLPGGGTGGTLPAGGSGAGGDTGGSGGTPTGGSGGAAGGSATGGTGGDPSGGTGGGNPDAQAPSNPNADCAARTLLQYLYDIMGTSILSGQESMFSDMGGWNPQFPSVRDSYVYDRVGKYPAVYSSDFGDVGTNNLHNRQDVVDNALRYAEAGSIIQLHYHIVQPDEPDGAGFNTMSQFSPDNPYPAANIDAILTPGDPLNTEHLRRLDELAGYLRQLQNAGVAVLWRPYHEMNGAWFWWGAQPRFTDLWIQMWDYLTNEHGLNNLLWVFSVNHWAGMPGNGPAEYYPGHAYVDVLGVDVYLDNGHDYEPYVHEELMSLGGGKPIAFSENGEMPNIPAISTEQPNWVYWATWWGYEDASSDALYSTNYGDPRVLTQDEVNVPACN